MLSAAREATHHGEPWSVTVTPCWTEREFRLLLGNLGEDSGKWWGFFFRLRAVKKWR